MITNLNLHVFFTPKGVNFKDVLHIFLDISLKVTDQPWYITAKKYFQHYGKYFLSQKHLLKNFHDWWEQKLFNFMVSLQKLYLYRTDV